MSLRYTDREKDLSTCKV